MGRFGQTMLVVVTDYLWSSSDSTDNADLIHNGPFRTVPRKSAITKSTVYNFITH